jgi:hypothetical protein
MADYYPLIAKAVAGLPSSTPETRSAIYQRARSALLGQLRRLEPPIPEDDVVRESAALEVAIARLEADLASPPQVAAPVEDVLPEAAQKDLPPEAIQRQPVEPQDLPAPVAESALPRAPVVAPAVPPGDGEPAIESGDDADVPVTPARSRQAPPPAFFKLRRDKPALFTPSQRPDGFPAPRAPALRQPLFPGPLGSVPLADNGSKPQAPGEAVGRSREPIVQNPPGTDLGAQTIVPDSFSEHGGRTSDLVASAGPAPGIIEELRADDGAANDRISPALAKARPEAQRPFAPQRPVDDAAPRRLWVVGFVVGLVVLLIAIAAFQLRDRPEELRQKAAAPIIAPDASSNGKIVDRIGVGQDGTQGAPASASADNAAAQGASAAKSTTDEATASGGRAALLIEAPEEASKVKTYLGSVVWKVDNVSNGPGEPLSTAVRAEIDIPEEKLQTVMTLQKNFDGSLPASHTMKVQFSEAADSPIGPIQQISVPQMRREDTATGDGLSGIPVTIMDNSFLVGLTRGNAEASNIDLLTSREWIDVPMLLSNGKIAKLTFEKGPTGVRAITDALTAWKSQ